MKYKYHFLMSNYNIHGIYSYTDYCKNYLPISP